MAHADPPSRSRFGGERVISAATLVLPLLAYVAVYFADGTGFHPNGDGYYSWIFARSLVFDGDFEFGNDYALCGDPFQVGFDRGTGRPDNPFYLGPGLFWTPPLLLLRGVFEVFLGEGRASAASCGGWMTALAILVGPACGALSVWFSYRAARLLVSSHLAAFVSLVFAFSSPLFPYSTSAAHYSHVYLTFTVAVLAYVSLRMILVGPRPRDWFWIASALCAAALHRLPAVLYAVVPFAAIVGMRRHPNSTHAIRNTAFGIAMGLLLGVGATALLYKFLYGRFWALPQGPDYVHLTHAHPWLVLFGVHGGFFFWMPAAWFAIPGLAIALRKPNARWFSLACLVASVVEVAVSAAPLDWHGNWSLGARRLLPLTPFVVIFSSIAIARLQALLPRSRRWAVALATTVVGLLLVNNIPAATTMRGDQQLSQRELYGALSPLRPLWTLFDRSGADFAILPAEIFFTLRYGMPIQSYRKVITPHYKREYRSLAFSDAELDLRTPEACSLASGVACSERGMEVATGIGRLVFAAEWPFATHVRLLVSSLQRDAQLSVGYGHAFGESTNVGVALLREAEEPTWIEFVLPPGTFDSGINEWIFESKGNVTISMFALDDRTPRTPHDPTPAPSPAPGPPVPP